MLRLFDYTLPWTSQPSPLHLMHGGGEGTIPGWELGPLMPRRAVVQAASIYAEMRQENSPP